MAADSKPQRTALFVSTQHWESHFRIGSHHIARAFAHRGWRVGYLSAPLSPLHLLGFGTQVSARLASWRRGGVLDPDSGVWHYVPFSLLPSAAAPGLRGARYVRVASRMCIPPIQRVLSRAGFLQPDVAYLDHFLHSGLVDAAKPRQTIFRVADRLGAFPGAGRDFEARQRRLAESSDVVICTTPSILAGMRTKNAILISNGVDAEHFARQRPKPPEYNGARPIALYVGACEDWVDIDLLARCARELDHVQVAVIGPFDGSPARRLRDAGALVLGPKPYETLPAYLQHAAVGLVPFAREARPALVGEISPLKLLEYVAAGLPAVAMEGFHLQPELASEVMLTRHRDQFVAAVNAAATSPRPVPNREVQAAIGWAGKLQPLFERFDALQGSPR